MILALLSCLGAIVWFTLIGEEKADQVRVLDLMMKEQAVGDCDSGICGIVDGALHLIMEQCAAMGCEFLEKFQKRIPHWPVSVAGC